MGLEGFFSRKPKEEKMDTPEQREADSKDRKVMAGIGLTGVALAGSIAMQEGVFDQHAPENNASARVDIQPGDLNPQMRMDAKGTTVELKDGQAVVTMAPPGNMKPVDVDLSSPQVNVDLSSKPVDINPK